MIIIVTVDIYIDLTDSRSYLNRNLLRSIDRIIYAIYISYISMFYSAKSRRKIYIGYHKRTAKGCGLSRLVLLKQFLHKSNFYPTSSLIIVVYIATSK